MKTSYVYILSNKNKTVLYIGITANLLERIESHKKGNGSIFTRKYNVIELMYFEEFNDITLAIKREKQLKKWNKDWKWVLIKKKNPELLDLYNLIQL